MPTKFYVSTFCNHAHALKTGKPIGHECETIPPHLLEMERNCVEPQGWGTSADWDAYFDAKDACRDAWEAWRTSLRNRNRENYLAKHPELRSEYEAAGHPERA